MKKMASKPIEVDENRQFRLKLPLFYAAIGVVGLLFGLFWIVLPFILSYTGEEMDILIITAFPLLGFVFFLLGIYLLLYYKKS